MAALCPFTVVAGLGAEDAVRYIVVELLSRYPGNAAEVVLSRQDAWHLFGIDVGTFREDQIPGLTLLEDAEEIRRYLLVSTTSRRVLISSAADGGGYCDIAAQHRDGLALVCLSSDLEPSLTISADGETTTLAVGRQVPDRLRLLPRQEAFLALTAMPTFSTL
ncbi:hypothetical protein BJF79_08750 [Actinomadura sp. CNU-125]|uniref:hypothetical protein n=1 Tax=Actinomadura sp. CNU-125 TaxID=1904961 RepID=UPI0009666685|nr:hypothetical protein [Actinomadura sp. CNU-125]OLT31873.1 hypothetical protein BJF79_08750 [Actinomadura sp. CNU-125]